MSKKKFIVLGVIFLIFPLGFFLLARGTNFPLTKLLSASCTINHCTFLFKGTDKLYSVSLTGNNLDLYYSPNYSFRYHGNYTIGISATPYETINYLLKLDNAEILTGSVIVQ